MTDFESQPLKIEDALELRGEICTSTSGYSMYPMLRHRRDVITVQKITRPLKENDVALYRLPTGKLVLHRILKVNSDGSFLIRGDNLYVIEHIMQSQIIGVLKDFTRDGKFYDCETDKRYKIYVFWIRHSFVLRKMWAKKIHPFLSKVKHSVIKG